MTETNDTLEQVTDYISQLPEEEAIKRYGEPPVEEESENDGNK